MGDHRVGISSRIGSSGIAIGKQMLIDLEEASWLPPFHADRLSEMSKETKLLMVEAEMQLRHLRDVGADKDMSAAAFPLLLEANAMHQKRQVLVYIKERLTKIQDLRWLSGVSLPEAAKERLCPSEISFFSEYCDALHVYQRELGELIGIDIDLTRELRPPNSLLAHVRVLASDGVTVTTGGHQLFLRKGQKKVLPMEDVDNFIRLGIMEEIVPTNTRD